MQDPYSVVTVMTDAPSGRCWPLPIRVGRREGRDGTGGLRGKEERKQLASKMNPRSSMGLCASPSVSTRVPRALSQLGRRARSPCRTF